MYIFFKYIPTDITKMNEFIYVGAKLVCDKIDIPIKESEQKFRLVCFGLVLWHINHCRLFNVKSIFIQINSSISNNSV